MKKILRGVKRKVMGVPFYNRMMIPYHYVRAGVSAARWGLPARRMKVIGVTGTNGKTTTCFMIWKMLNEAGIKTGVMTTVGWGVSEIHKQVEHMTTESAGVLNERMRKLYDAGVEVLVLEVTSHALVQGRILGVPIEVAVMTNVTHEHLDYHKTFLRYVAAKCKLFVRAKFGVVNADDESFERFLEKMRRRKYASYGIKNGDFRASGVKLGVSGVKYAFGDIKKEREFEIKTRIPGKFNVYNSLAAACVGRYFGLSDQQIADGIYALTEVEGRMNLIDEGQDFRVLVDYAHTPDAILKVFEAMGADGDVDGASKGEVADLDGAGREGKKKGRIIAVHGGAGRRDESTRAMRGEIIGAKADVFIVTEDDTRDEDVREICAEFVRGAKEARMKFFANLTEVEKALSDDVSERVGCVIFDRREAIFAAIKLARKGDVVMILGKGHEKTILRASGAEPFEDIKVAREGILERMEKRGDKGGSLRF